MLRFLSEQSLSRNVFIKETTSVGEDAVKKKPFYTAGGNVNLYSHYGN
jgi:hypothetical protein